MKRFELIPTKGYRRDIDGLRAIAVLAVIFFHFGWMPNGFLGVDVFFAISGYLITGIIYRELEQNKFSIFNFYVRRTRRIIPLSLFIASLSLGIGYFVMLPDDLENLAQSVVATNFFGNNVLQVLTTGNYWDVTNEFKPLMHTWSLGVEEQYYFVYPFLLLLAVKVSKRTLLPTLAVLTVVSLLIFFAPFSDDKKFYLLPFRFFELSVGGMAAILTKHRLVKHRFSLLLVAGLLVVLCLNSSIIPAQASIILTVCLSTLLLISANTNSSVSSLLLENKIAVGVGLISYSLYMWHQPVLAFTRYFLVQNLEVVHLLLILVATILFSIGTFFLVERPFRDRRFMKTSTVLSVLIPVMLISSITAYYIHHRGGIVRDVPELGLSVTDATPGIHKKYNGKIHRLNRPFSDDSSKTKVLVIGDSFARDWSNVLLESKIADSIEISYVAMPSRTEDFDTRAEAADLIFYSRGTREDVDQHHLDSPKLFVVGTKNFGINSGYFYNYKGEDYFEQRTAMEGGYLETNNELKQEWEPRFFDYIAKVIDDDGTVPVFTPDHKFISQDCRHLTRAGAIYFAELFEDRLQLVLERLKQTKSHSESEADSDAVEDGIAETNESTHQTGAR